MSYSRPRSSQFFVSAAMAVVAGVISAPPVGVAREGQRINHETDIPVLSAPTRRGFDEIIVRMAPLRPAPGAVAAKPAPAPGVARDMTPVIEANKDAAAPKDAAKVDAPHGAAAAAPQTARIESKPEPKTGEQAVATAPSIGQQNPARGDKGLDLRIGEAAMPAKVATAEAAKPAIPAVVPAPEATAANGLDVKIGEPAASRSVVLAAPAAPIAQQSPAPAAQTAKEPELKVGEPAAPRSVVVAAQEALPPAAPMAQQAPAPAAQPAAAPRLKIDEPTTPLAAPAPAAQAAKGPDLNAAEPTAPAAVPEGPQNSETQAYAALLAQGVRGPVEVRLAERATMWLPASRVYLDAQQARKLIGAGKNWDDATQGVVLPTTSRPDWMAYVSLVDDGHISDRDASGMNPEAVLGTYKAKVAAENPGRAARGLTTLEVAGWMEAPRYDSKHHLSSCVGATLVGSKIPEDRIVNCGSFALGGQGALKIVVAGQEANYPRFRGEAGALVDTIVYDKGKGYEDVDLATVKTAPYGLVALITGDTNLKKVTVANAAAPAQKLGLIALLIVYALKFGKMLLVGAAVVAAFFRWVARFRKPSDKKPAKEQVAEAPIWSRAIEAARAKLGSRGEPAEKVAAATTTAESELEEAAQGTGAESDVEETAPKTGVAAALAALRAKLPPLPFGRKAPEAATPAAPQSPRAVAPAKAAVSTAASEDDQSPATSLARLASLMRKKAPEVPVHVDLSRLDRRASSGLAAASAPIEEAARSEPEILRPLPGAAPLAAKPKPAAPAPEPRVEPAPAAAPEPFALIEPGDEAAASLAISARESLREAKG